jgi:hypothetical protein
MASPAPARLDAPHAPLRPIPPGPLGSTPMRSCWNCREERSFQGAPVCLLYLAVAGRFETCDRWDGGYPLRDQAGIVVHWYHGSIPTDAEMAVLESHVKLPPGPPPPTVEPYGRNWGG